MYVVSFAGKELLGILFRFQRIAHFLHTLYDGFKLDVHDTFDGFQVQLVEIDNVIQTVQEFRSELFVQRLLDDFAAVLLVGCRRVRAAEPDALAEIFQLARSAVRCHDDDRVLEIHRRAVAVRQSSFVHHLQQDVEHVAMCFFQFVEE